MKQSTKRLISFAIALAFIFAALFVFSSLIRPAYTEAQRVKSELLSRQTLLENQKAAVEQVKALIDSYRGEGTFVEAASFVLPNSKQEAEAVHQITQLASINALTLQTLAVSSPSVQNLGRNGISQDAGLAKPVGNLNIQMRVAGTYDSFKTFLENIETNIRIMDVRNMAVSPVGKSNQDFYVFDLTVVAYYQNL